MIFGCENSGQRDGSVTHRNQDWCLSLCNMFYAWLFLEILIRCEDMSGYIESTDTCSFIE